MSQLRDLAPNRAVILDNGNCPYCGVVFDGVIPTDTEHAIGRRFVPRGTLQGCWNLLLRACVRCNQAKANLEDDISAISMQPDAVGRFACDDPRLRSEAMRKAKTFSRRTRKAVGDSRENSSVEADMGALKMKASFVMPPQVERDRLYELARLQLQAFFFHLTYDSSTERGGFWLGGNFMLTFALKSDWGNAQLRWFQEQLPNWIVRWSGVAADGFYKVRIFRVSEDIALFPWVIEWNKNFRITGFFGDEDAMTALSPSIPELVMHCMDQPDGSIMRFRMEVPLPEDADRMFT